MSHARPILFVGLAAADSRRQWGAPSGRGEHSIDGWAETGPGEAAGGGMGLGVAALVEPGRLPGFMARLLAVGPFEEVVLHPGSSGAKRVDLGQAVLMPGLVNAHTHLDLTHLGPVDYNPAGGFTEWAGRIVRGRRYEAGPLRESVLDGAARALAGGVVAVGDISGDWQTGPIRAVQETCLLGVGYLEFFGMGGRQAATIERLVGLLPELIELNQHPRFRAGLSPHAPYTAGLEVYAWAARAAREHGLGLSTHLAENPDEREIVGQGTGVFRGLLQQLGIWDDSILREIGRGAHPIDHMAERLREGAWLAAHVNDCPDEQLETLVSSGVSVVYCPRSSEYFGAAGHYGPHRYREMLARGVRVALGTDSVLNVPKEASARLSPLDEMRLLYARDGTHAATLLGMATVNGAHVLGLNQDWFRLKTGGALAGLVAVDVGRTPKGEDPLDWVMNARSAARLLVRPDGSVADGAA